MDSPKRQLKQGTSIITIPRGGRAGTADPATAGPMFRLRWCCQPFTWRRENTHIVCTDLPEFKHNRELRRSWKQADFECGGHTFLAGIARNRIKSKCKAKAGVCRFFTWFSGYTWNSRCRWTSISMHDRLTHVLRYKYHAVSWTNAILLLPGLIAPLCHSYIFLYLCMNTEAFVNWCKPHK